MRKDRYWADIYLEISPYFRGLKPKEIKARAMVKGKEITVYYKEKGYEKINRFFSEGRFSKLFILVDGNTHEYCLSWFLQKLISPPEIEIIEMEQGEENKTIETCNSIWGVLSELGGDRKSVVVNLGGGIITDMGGFIAATFKRGIPFINVPTTLLAMVDAAVGGKTGVNLHSLKNQIGVIQPAELVMIDSHFLKTLPPPQMRSGLAEMLKHGLINDEAYWERLLDLENKSLDDLDDLIMESIEIKESIVQIDPREENIRKSLNYGHTIGHAIETYFLESPSRKSILHGEAVAAGMIMATYLSSVELSFPKEKMDQISEALRSIYGTLDLEIGEFEKISELMKFDKKNEGGNINFVLLKDIGQPVVDCQVSSENLKRAFAYYLKIS